MSTLNIVSHNRTETIALGKRIAKYLKSGDIVCLFGDLGSGKTTFVKGLAQGLNIKQTKVNSPTFVLMNTYEGKFPLYHFDFYRLDELQDIAAIGYEEFLYGHGIAVIEWAEKMGSLLPKENLSIHLNFKGDEERVVSIHSSQKRFDSLVKKLKK